MSREAMSEEERRRRRNEASRRCYLRRKAELAAQSRPVGAKNKRPKAKAVEAKQAKPARRGPDPIAAAERLCKTYAKIANGVKPMIKDAAEFLGVVYKSEDQRVIEKVERILAKGLGVGISRLASDPTEKTRVCLDAVSKAVKTPKFRLTSETPAVPEPEPAVPEPEPAVPESDKEDEPAELPVDPALLEKVDAGEADKSEIEIPQSKNDDSDEDEDEDELDPESAELENEDEDEEDDEDDESEEAQERRARRREREESDNVRDWESGRWEMMGEMGAQGAFDD